MPAVAKLVENAFGQAPSRTLNAKEVVSRGCALACAMLSPVFKVSPKDVGNKGLKLCELVCLQSQIHDCLLCLHEPMQL